jgi:hypothetical protein
VHYLDETNIFLFLVLTPADVANAQLHILRDISQAMYSAEKRRRPSRIAQPRGDPRRHSQCAGTETIVGRADLMTLGWACSDDQDRFLTMRILPPSMYQNRPSAVTT